MHKYTHTDIHLFYVCRGYKAHLEVRMGLVAEVWELAGPCQRPARRVVEASLPESPCRHCGTV